MERVLQTHRLGPHRVDVVEVLDDEGGGLVQVVVDGTVVTDPALERVPTVDEVLGIYARWRQRSAGA